MLSWEIKISKQQGLFRPYMRVFFRNSKTNKFNIKSWYEFPKWVFVLPGNKLHPIDKCPNKDHDVCDIWNDTYITDFRFYKYENIHKNEFIDCIGCSESSYRMGLVPFKNDLSLFSTEQEYSFYLAWRPGKPDYSDYVEFIIKEFCIPAIEEYQKRIIAAEVSVEILEKTIKMEENYKPQQQTQTQTQQYRKINLGGN